MEGVEVAVIQHTIGSGVVVPILQVKATCAFKVHELVLIAVSGNTFARTTERSHKLPSFA